MIRAFAAAALCLAGCGATSSSPTTVAPTTAAPATPFVGSAAVWYHPEPSAASWTGAPSGMSGSFDFLSLFAAGAPWPHVMGRTSVLGLYAGWVLGTDDQTLQQTVAFAAAHRMGIELEAPALQATVSCGTGVEGYVPTQTTVSAITLSYLNRLKALNADVRFIKVDEPFFFGSVVNDPRACGLSVANVASQVNAYVQIVQTIYPNVQIGDVEPIITSQYVPDVATAMSGFHAAYKSASGAPFPFFFADIDFSNPSWATLVKTLEVQTRREGSRFGIIYIGDQLDTSDAEWTGKVVARFTAYEGATGGRPDYALFQSWEPHPQYNLPETNAGTFTGAINIYLGARS
jgi:hypothetical protein